MLNSVHLTLFSCTEETFKHLQGHKKKSNNYTQPKHFPAGVKHSSFVSINGLKPMMKRSFAPPIVPAPFSRLLIKFHRTCRSHSHVFWHSRKKKVKPILSSGSVVKGFRNPSFRIGSAIYYSLQHVGPSVICKKKRMYIFMRRSKSRLLRLFGASLLNSSRHQSSQWNIKKGFHSTTFQWQEAPLS